MWLTKNEKKVLKLLIDDAKLSDTSIANRLNISSQAIGRIRKKLEEDIIKAYTVELHLSKLGLNLLSLVDAHYQKKSEKEIKEKLPNYPEVINIFKLMGGTNRCKMVRLDSNLEECEKSNLEIGKLLEISEIQTIPLSNIVKYNIKPALHKAIDELGTKSKKLKFSA